MRTITVLSLTIITVLITLFSAETLDRSFRKVKSPVKLVMRHEDHGVTFIKAGVAGKTVLDSECCFPNEFDELKNSMKDISAKAPN